MPDADPKADVLLVDGKHLYWRAASATLLDVEGSPTGGIYAFVRSLCKVHERFGGEIIVCWEGGSRRALKRTMAFPEYKKHKAPDPEREVTLEVMADQIKQLHQLLSALGITQAKAPGWEADDAMATLARRAAKNGHVAAIYSGDSDMYQCVNDRVFMIRPITKDIEVITPEGVAALTGVAPSKIPLWKALSGDTSDGIPGVNGIGKVGAARLVNELGSIVNVMRAARAGEKPEVTRFGDRAWEALRQAATDGQLTLWWRLARVNSRATVLTERSTLDTSALIQQLRMLKFRSLLSHREMYRLKGLTKLPE
jgi:5'-3' exonuclease